MKSENIISVLLLFLCTTLLMGCEKFLSEKPDKQLATPRNGQDLQAVLDYVDANNMDIPTGAAEGGTDDLYLSNASWNSFNANYRMDYTWEKLPLFRNYWRRPYSAIQNANVVLDNLDRVTFKNEEEKRQIKGAALFLRAYHHFHVAQVFAPPYHETTADLQGIPVRRTSDVNVAVFRETVKRTYELVLEDLLTSCRLLSAPRPAYPTRPGRAAAYGALARVYLAMREYHLAGIYADSCLQLHDGLNDFNDFSNKTNPYPFEKFNQEVIFFSQMTGQLLVEARARVDTALYRRYQDHDLRKRLYFTPKESGFVAFTGDFGQNTSGWKFNGLTTAEMLLIRMESSVRANKRADAVRDLEQLVAHRYQKPYPTYEGKNDGELLSIILDERRKELLFRGI